MDTLNLELRQEITEIALHLEHGVNKLIAAYLNIEKDTTKTIGNRSSSLSFKNKIDLLHDLEILNDGEHKDLLLLMEFRNQFLHNFDCSSFEKAVEFLGADRGKKLLAFTDIIGVDIELKYRLGYKRLFMRCLDILGEKHAIKSKTLEDKRNLILGLHTLSQYVIEGFFSSFDNTVYEFCSNDVLEKDSAEVLIIKMEIFKSMSQKLSQLTETAQFIELKEQLNISFNKELIKSFLR